MSSSGFPPEADRGSTIIKELGPASWCGMTVIIINKDMNEKDCCEVTPSFWGQLKAMIKKWRNDPRAYQIEKRLIKLLVASGVLLAVLQAIGIAAFFREAATWQTRLGYLLWLLVPVIVTNGGALWHLTAYRRGVAHMSGMMIGMTIGMISGFEVGALIGASSGMFWGAVWGMLVGIIVGGYAGSCCGLMGILEGWMAGLMAGTMGAMLSVMLLNDHLFQFLIILVVVGTLILAGLSSLVYEEHKAYIQKDEELRSVYAGFRFGPFLSLCFGVMMILSWVIVWGPKSVIVQ